MVRGGHDLCGSLYSNYKHRITFKALVVIAPNGTVNFLSDLYPGSVSDKAIVQDCGILSKLVPGDSVMADKIGDILPPGVTLNIPPFKTTPQMTPEQIEATLSIAAPRVHVERAIRTIKTMRVGRPGVVAWNTAKPAFPQF